MYQSDCRMFSYRAPPTAVRCIFSQHCHKKKKKTRLRRPPPAFYRCSCASEPANFILLLILELCLPSG